MKKLKTIKKSNKIITIFSIFIITLYVFLKIVNRLTYEGFVFNKFHVLPDNFLWPALISILGIAVVWIPQVNFRKLLKIQSIIIVFALLIITQNLYHIYKSKWENFQYIVAHPYATYGDKMRRGVGSIFYNYTLFIDKYTSENSILLIPPQGFPWPQTGNASMLRYFVYPRKISNGKEFDPPSKDILKDIDYVLLNWGESDETEGAYTHDWPKFDVEAEEIIFMNKDGSFGGEVKGDYHYKDYKGKQVWGLIVVKH